MTTKLAIALALMLGAAACSDSGMATRNAPLPTLGLGETQPQARVRDYTVTRMQFHAPADLRVSEGNGYYPFADVVWRGDPVGDRIAQIGAIFQTAMDRGTADLAGSTPVVVDIALARFHGVTERTHFSVGGVYNIVFSMTVLDARTGAVIEPAREIVANLSAPGGNAAIVAELNGQTEKVRVTDYLTQVLHDELQGQALTAAM